MAAGLLLTLFGHRLGTVGKLAKGALVLYPLVKGAQAIQKPNAEPPYR